MPRQLPNLITAGRLVLAVLLFVLLAAVDHARAHSGAAAGTLAAAVAGRESLILNLCLVIFVAAAVSDILDGQIARRYGLQTDFGRIVDPFADKVVVCGTFVQLVPLEGAGVASWMVVVILARELLVDGLRGFAEAKGVAFPALVSGKLKMVAQSVCLSWILCAMANFRAAGDVVRWVDAVTLSLLGLTLLATVVSGAQYVLHARRVLASTALDQLTVPEQPAAPERRDEPVPSGPPERAVRP